MLAFDFSKIFSFHCWNSVPNCLRLQTTCPDVLELFIQSNLFKPTSQSANNPKAMADKFNVPYFGSIPMDPNMMAACEEGRSFLEVFPASSAARSFSSIVEQVIAATSK